MKIIFLFSFLFLLPSSLLAEASSDSPTSKKECIILLHGMGRTKMSMLKAELQLKSKGYKVVNLNYPSTDKTIDEITKSAIPKALKLCGEKVAKTHFLTHSLGGIIVRNYLQKNKLRVGSRVVMLAPPNKGSEVTDYLKDFFLYKATTGPAGQVLGTDKDSFPNKLKPIGVEVGIITGNQTIEPWFSALIDGLNDGKVSVGSAKLKEATDFLVLDKTHTFIMMSEEVIDQAEHFFRLGAFNKKF